MAEHELEGRFVWDEAAAAAASLEFMQGSA